MLGHLRSISPTDSGTYHPHFFLCFRGGRFLTLSSWEIIFHLGNRCRAQGRRNGIRRLFCKRPSWYLRYLSSTRSESGIRFLERVLCRTSHILSGVVLSLTAYSLLFANFCRTFSWGTSLPYIPSLDTVTDDIPFIVLLSGKCTPLRWCPTFY